MHSMYIFALEIFKGTRGPSWKNQVNAYLFKKLTKKNLWWSLFFTHSLFFISKPFFSELNVFDIRPVSICISRSEIWQIKLCFWKLNYAQDSFLSEIWSKTLEMKTISTVYNCPGPKFFLSCEVEKLNVFGWKLLLSRSRSPLRQYQ